MYYELLGGGEIPKVSIKSDVNPTNYAYSYTKKYMYDLLSKILSGGLPTHFCA